MMITVIHHLTDMEALATELPLLLSGKKPTQPSSGDVGSQDYSRPAEAVVTGGAITVSMVEVLRSKCQESLKVPWMTQGMTEQERDVKLQQPPDPVKYGPIVAKRMKEAMRRVREGGKWGQDGVYVY